MGIVQSSHTATIAAVFKIDWEIEAMHQHWLRESMKPAEGRKKCFTKQGKKETLITAISILNISLKILVMSVNETFECVADQSLRLCQDGWQCNTSQICFFLVLCFHGTIFPKNLYLLFTRILFPSFYI